MFLIISLEIPTRLRHKAAYLACQEHLGQDVGIVVEAVPPEIISDRNRNGRLAWRCFQRKVDGFVTLDAERGIHVLLASIEEETVSKNTPFCVEDGKLIDARGPAPSPLPLWGSANERQDSGIVALPQRGSGEEADHFPLAHQAHAQAIVLQISSMSDMSNPAAIGLLHFQGNARLLWFWQFRFGLLAIFADEENLFLQPFLRNDLEESSAPIHSLD